MHAFDFAFEYIEDGANQRVFHHFFGCWPTQLFYSRGRRLRALWRGFICQLRVGGRLRFHNLNLPPMARSFGFRWLIAFDGFDRS